MIRLLLFLLLSLGLDAKPEKDFQLYCEESIASWNLFYIYKYRGDNGKKPRLEMTKLTGENLQIKDESYSVRDPESNPSKYDNENNIWKILSFSTEFYDFAEQDDDTYYFGDFEIKYIYGEFMKLYEIRLNRKNLNINEPITLNYDPQTCSLVDNDTANKKIQLWKEFSQDWLTKYPKPEEPKNKL